MSAAPGARVKATFVSVVLQKWYSPRASVAMVRSAPGARGRPGGEERGGRSAEGHTRTAAMEKRAPLGRTSPSNGTPPLTWLLVLHGLTRKCFASCARFVARRCTFRRLLNRRVVAGHGERRAGLVRAVFRSEPASLKEANSHFGWGGRETLKTGHRKINHCCHDGDLTGDLRFTFL